LRVQVNRSQELVICGVPITDSFTALGTFVKRDYIAGIDLKGAGVGNLCLRILPRSEVGISLGNEFLLSNVGVSRTAAEDNRHDYKRESGGALETVMTHKS
jgi:hypothetical protein